MEKNKFVGIMTGLCEMYNKEPSKFLINTYYEIFKKFTTDEFGNAVTSCLKNRPYNSLPKPAEILEYLEGTRDDKALAAWIEARKAVVKIGMYETVEFDNPIISHCIKELGGWEAFCSVDDKERPFIEKRFCEYYRLFLKRGIKEPTKLPGIIEIKNTEKGQEIPKPKKLTKKRNPELLSKEEK
jgi:hypothetical protein